jgi:hypothetical protein
VWLGVERDGGVLLAVRADASRYDDAREILGRHDADLGATATPRAGTADWPGGEDVPLTRNDRRQYLSGPEDVARTTEARDPDDLEIVDDGTRRP